MNSSAKVDGMVGSPLLHFSYRIRKKDATVYSLSAPSTAGHLTGCEAEVGYLCPCELLLNDFVVRFHVFCKFQIVDGVLMTAVDTLKHKHATVRQQLSFPF